ncbi:MAG: GGDEF domain-containing phosphodiesterase [Bacilli bacterium]|nr:GGDEF domain-containing phosphodiesterase [Bacilli bacterium]
MRKIVQSTYIFFIFILGVVFVATYFFYRYTSTEFLEKRVANNLTMITETVSETLSYKIDSDYRKLSDYMEGKEDTDISLESLDDLFSEDISMGKLLAKGIEYQGATLSFQESFIPESTIKNAVSVIQFSEMIEGSTDENPYVFFRLEETLFVIPAEQYFANLFLSPNNLPENMYFLVKRDGLIEYQTNNNANNKFYDYYIRHSNSEQITNQVKAEFYEGLSSYRASIYFEGKQYYLCYSPFREDTIASDFYVAYLFETKSAFANFGMLTYQLVLLYIVYGLILVIAIFSTYIIMMKKNSDIEGSMVIHYFDKPYIIKVNKNGKILGFNQTLRRIIYRRNHYKNINQFDHEEGVNLINCIKTQAPFTVYFEDIDGLKRSALLIPVKNVLSKYLVGTDLTFQDSNYKLKAKYNLITNLPNYEMLVEAVDRDIKSIEHGVIKEQETAKSALVLFDIKQFNNFNKVFGRKMGDMIVSKVAQRVKEYLDDKGADLFHTEVDLFAILFTKLSAYEQAITYVDEMITLFKKPLEIENNNLIVEIKCGIFNIEPQKYDKLDAKKAYDNCQITLTQAKSLTSIRYSVYNATFSTAATKEQAMAKDLSSAIEKEEFVMYYQPQYHNEKQKIVGFEALVRWDNPKYKFQSPSVFIELAEKNNMIIQIGRYIMEKTFATAKEFERHGIHISMNVSPVQLMQAGFVNEVLDCAKKYDLQPGTIAIEITETFLMENFTYIIEKLNLLRNKGFSIHLDDFGTGYSSMLYLKELPINTIKIDKEFIRHLATDKHSRAIVGKIVSLAKSLDLDIIAEGVEKDDQNQILIKMGCDIIQGYLISKGVSYEEAIVLINEYNIDKTKQIATLKKAKKG